MAAAAVEGETLAWDTAESAADHFGSHFLSEFCHFPQGAYDVISARNLSR